MVRYCNWEIWIFDLLNFLHFQYKFCSVEKCGRSWKSIFELTTTYRHSFLISQSLSCQFRNALLLAAIIMQVMKHYGNRELINATEQLKPPGSPSFLNQELIFWGKLDRGKESALRKRGKHFTSRMVAIWSILTSHKSRLADCLLQCPSQKSKANNRSTKPLFHWLHCSCQGRGGLCRFSENLNVLSWSPCKAWSSGQSSKITTFRRKIGY